MKLVARLLLIFSLLLAASLAASPASAQTAPAPANTDGMCPISLDLNQEEHDAYIGFNVALSWLDGYYGTDGFQAQLNAIITKQWPVKKVIEVGPVFLEKTLNLVDQAQLRNVIAQTVGLDNQAWKDFEYDMRHVSIFSDFLPNRYHQFTAKTKKLTDAIQNLPASSFKYKVYSAHQADTLRARAITAIANMAIFLGRWDILNRAIAEQRAAGAGKQFLFTSLSLTAGALLGASIVYAAPAVAAVGTFAVTSLDGIVAANIARIGGQIFGGVLMGAVGAPTGLLLTDTTSSVMEALRRASNGHTVYACELDKQMQDWRARGVSPYLSASLLGGMVGLGGGLTTLFGLSAKVALAATSFGVGVAEAYTLGQVGDNEMKALAEYQLAVQAQAAGNNVEARLHLEQSRYYAQLAGARLVEGLAVGALSVSIASEFGPALREGQELIRVVIANSSDTLPMALNIMVETAKQLFVH